MQIISNIALISINETMVVQVLSFLIFLFLINRIMLRPLKSTMEERDDFISILMKEIKTTQTEMESVQKQLQKKEESLRMEADEMGAHLEVEGHKKAEKLHEELNQKIQELRDNTDSDVKAMMIEARKQLQTESDTLADIIIEKILNRRLAS